jgi:hypothetical protein
MLDGVNGIAAFQCEQILGERYFRLAPTFPVGTSIGMDDVERIPDLVAFAEGLDLEPLVAWLTAGW